MSDDSDEKLCNMCERPATHTTYYRGTITHRCTEHWADWIRAASEPAKPEKQLIFVHIGDKKS